MNQCLAEANQNNMLPPIIAPTIKMDQFIESGVGPGSAGKKRITVMKSTHAHAIIETGILYLPRFQGPGSKELPAAVMRKKIGIL